MVTVHDKQRFETNKVKEQQQQNKGKTHQNSCQSRESNLGRLNTAVRCFTAIPTNLLNASIVVNLINCFNVLCRYINKQGKFYYILTSTDNCIWQSLIFTLVGSTVLVAYKLMKGKALRKHSLHEKTAASVLLKLFISGNE